MAASCSSLISCSPDMLLSYYKNDFEMVPVAPIIIGIALALCFHIPHAVYLYCKVFIF